MNQPPSVQPDRPTPPRDERSAVRQVLIALGKAGWSATGLEYSDGEFCDADVRDRGDLESEIFAVDNVFMHVKRGDETAWLYFVFGNDPEEVVCNSSLNVDQDLQDLYRKWTGL